MDQFTRRIIGFGIHAGTVDGAALCRMFHQAVRKQSVPKYLIGPLFFRSFRKKDRELSPFSSLFDFLPLSVCPSHFLVMAKTSASEDIPRQNIAAQWTL